MTVTNLTEADVARIVGTFLDASLDLTISYGWSIVAGVATLVLGWVAAGWVRRGVAHALERFPNIDETLIRFLSSLARYTVLAVTLLAVLAKLGVQTASLIAVFGAAGLAIGLALQGTLSNVAAGVMLLFFRPYRIGDHVIVGGQEGVVKSLDLFMTEIATFDNQRVMVPNGQIWGSAITNFSYYPTRRINLTIGIDYGDDIETAVAVAQRLIAADRRCLTDPTPVVAVDQLGDNAVNLAIRVWVATENWASVRFDLIRAIKEEFDKAGITIPFPQRTFHFVGEGRPPAPTR